MDGGRAPNGIGHLIILFMAGGICHTHLCTYILHNHSFNFSGGVRSLGIALLTYIHYLAYLITY